MHNLIPGNDLTRSLKHLQQQLDLIDAAIAALTRYRDACRQQPKLPARLPPSLLESTGRFTQAGS